MSDTSHMTNTLQQNINYVLLDKIRTGTLSFEETLNAIIPFFIAFAMQLVFMKFGDITNYIKNHIKNIDIITKFGFCRKSKYSKKIIISNKKEFSKNGLQLVKNIY